MNVGGLFDGCGLLAYGLHLAGLEHRWLCEVDPFRRELLAKRWPGVPVFDDVRAVGADSAERVDIIAGGFPCKGASTAGKRTGFDHPETVLWREMARAVGELRPRHVLVENVANILALKSGAVWGEVLGDLVALRYDTVWDCIPAAAFGAPHGRDRVIAIATNTDQGGRGEGAELAARPGSPRGADRTGSERDGAHAADSDVGAVEPGRLRRGERGRDQAAAPDPVGSRGTAGRRRQREGSGQSGTGRRDHAQPSAEAVADSDRERLSESHGTFAGGPSFARAADDRALVANANGDGVREQPESEPGCRGATLARGVAVEWGDYGAAIARWEAIHGRAPEPLVRRVDDRRTMRVERSRLSALGDGVQVQLGQMAGAYLMSLESK